MVFEVFEYAKTLRALIDSSKRYRLNINTQPPPHNITTRGAAPDRIHIRCN